MDRTYYERRLREERERATGPDSVSARVHAELADAYEKLLGASEHKADAHDAGESPAGERQAIAA